MTRLYKKLKKFIYKKLVRPFKKRKRRDRERFDPLLDNKLFIGIMQVSERTAQRWRSNGHIGYYKLRNRIYYSWSDIQIFYKENYNSKK
ncbi:MAG: hypothetical protein ACI87N_001085 [Flavobacteriales bacterium]|jgi:hypothetical protein